MAVVRTPIKIPLSSLVKEHWTDWIPARVKDKITLLFDAVPVVPRGKRKIPFQRTMLPHQHETAKVRLLTKTRKEMETLEKQIHINPTDARIDKLTQIRRAIKIIEALDKNEAVPATWTMMLPILLGSPVRRSKSD